MDVFIAAATHTKFGKIKKSLIELFVDAGNEAIEASNINEFDAIFIGAQNPEEFAGEGNIASQVVDHLALTPTPTFRIETASSSGAAVFHIAYQYLASGLGKRALVLAGEKMTGVKTPTATRILAEVIDRSERAAGVSMPSLAAIITKYYMHKYHMHRNNLSLVAVKNHYNGTLNPRAHLQKQITIEDVNKSKVIADPLRLYDCCPISDGAAACILTTEKTNVKVIGIGSATDHVPLRNREGLTSFLATRKAAERAYKMAGISPAQITFAELHDAFTPFEIIDSEDVGFFEHGTGWKAVKEGITQIDGKLPINPSGGLKSRGHPVGGSGLAQIVELFWQMTGSAGKRQVSNPKYGLAQSIGGLATNNFVTILEAL